MTKKYDAIIWKQSVMENDFRCTKCGRQLFRDGELADDVLIEQNRTAAKVICPGCRQHVAMLTTVEMAERLGAMRRHEA